MPLALILGGAQCVWHDAARALQLCTPDAFIAINDMIPRWPGRIDYAVSLHADQMHRWSKARKDNPQKWSVKQMVGAGIQKTTNDWGGSSGLFAVKIAREEGMHAILCGVPMSAVAGHFVRGPDKWKNCNTFLPAWEERVEELKPFVRSMSGWTAVQFGEPTPDWLTFLKSAPSDPEGVLSLLEIGDAEA